MPNDALGAVGAQANALARASDMDRAVSASAQARAGKAEAAAKKFEELLGSMLIKEMRRGVSDGFFGTAPGADIFEGWLDEHMGKALARDGVFDLVASVRASTQGSPEPPKVDADGRPVLPPKMKLHPTPELHRVELHESPTLRPTDLHKTPRLHEFVRAEKAGSNAEDER